MGKKPVREVGESAGEGNNDAERVDGREVGGTTEAIPDSGGKSEYVFNPADFGSDSDASKPGDSPSGDYSQPKRKRRGKQAKKEATSHLTNILIQSHFMLAKLLDAEELLLNHDEANNFAQAIERVESLYEKSFISEEASAWIGLTIAAATIYGPRYIAMRARQRKENENKEPINVEPISTGYAESTLRN